MKLLLDTHALLWFANEPEKLSYDAMNAIMDSSHVKYVSIVSAWECAIKVNIGKMTLDLPTFSWVEKQLARNGFNLLPITMQHIAAVETLPLHHRDPFDRMLIAQSFAEKMALVSADDAFSLYAIDRIWQ